VCLRLFGNISLTFSGRRGETLERASTTAAFGKDKKSNQRIIARRVRLENC